MIRSTDLENRAVKWPDDEPTRRGRKPKEGTIVVSVRVKNSTYDHYCRLALVEDEHVRTLMRKTLERHDPCRHGNEEFS